MMESSNKNESSRRGIVLGETRTDFALQEGAVPSVMEGKEGNKVGDEKRNEDKLSLSDGNTSSSVEKQEDVNDKKKRDFPWKLHTMLQESAIENTEHIASWCPGGKSFKIHNPETFVDTLMPKYFNQTQYRSFQRMLNLYNFKKIIVGPSRGGYVHPLFDRADVVLCQQMKIRAKNNSPRNRVMISQQPQSETKQVDSPQAAAGGFSCERDRNYYSPFHEQKLEQGRMNRSLAAMINDHLASNTVPRSLYASSIATAANVQPTNDLSSSFFASHDPQTGGGRSDVVTQQYQQHLHHHLLYPPPDGVRGQSAAMTFSSHFLQPHQQPHQSSYQLSNTTGTDSPSATEGGDFSTAAAPGGERSLLSLDQSLDFNVAMMFPSAAEPQQTTRNSHSLLIGPRPGVPSRAMLPPPLLQQREGQEQFRQRSDASALSQESGASSFHEPLSDDLEPRPLPP